MINEWIDMDGIVLARLRREVGRAAAVESDAEGSEGIGEGQEGKEEREGKEQERRERKEGDLEERKKKKVETHNGIAEIRERIAGMRRWRKEVERAVVWQREEGWRVEERMGRKREREKGGLRGEDVDVDGVGDGGGERRRWSVKGKVPSQREWEGIFCRE